VASRARQAPEPWTTPLVISPLAEVYCGGDDAARPQAGSKYSILAFWGSTGRVASRQVDQPKTSLTTTGESPVIQMPYEAAVLCTLDVQRSRRYPAPHVPGSHRVPTLGARNPRRYAASDVKTAPWQMDYRTYARRRISARASASAVLARSVSRLSCSFLPLATAISHLIRPFFR
jgi:hypothetical protein